MRLMEMILPRDLGAFAVQTLREAGYAETHVLAMDDDLALLLVLMWFAKGPLIGVKAL
ncbi:hypothetical protein SAMN02746041_01994 [Desulfacinum hydrothermale DSM 13146]|uniref:Uncharacterized protein n=1 Tax=Desulfacinum hydrothermale DSM 13146 TaxID=1121390 RepID=A0A1W1XKF0_9BACT|nr:hypothetical protein [Desulfacinum hydrothermale]SMC24436.1 hypothetical protein SAMN02746041_01994 [Desulfacinum hydrothermale DSM 13146]